MCSVTQRIAQIKQPRGGYLPVKIFEKIQLQDNAILCEEENIPPILVGLTVDYLTRFLIGTPIDEAFSISLRGAWLVNKEEIAIELLSKIVGLDDNSIISACKLCGFDVCVRAGISKYKPIENINPDKNTISNIKVMVMRGMTFFDKYGPVIKQRLTFQGGYTDTISSGDGDFMTKDTLWDFKVTKLELKSKYTLQLLVYYIMGLHSIHSEYKDIKKLGFYNPRLNRIYILPVEHIEPDLISQVERDVIGYKSEKRNKKAEMSGDLFFMEREYYTTLDIAHMLNRSRGYVYKLIKNGSLPAVKIKNKYQIEKSDFIKYYEKLKRQEKFLIVFLIVIVMMWLFFLGFL